MKSNLIFIKLPCDIHVQPSLQHYTNIPESGLNKVLYLVRKLRVGNQVTGIVFVLTYLKRDDKDRYISRTKLF